MQRITAYLLSLVLSLVAVSAVAQYRIYEPDTLAYEVHFRWDKSRIDTKYLGNDRVFARMAEQIDSIGDAKINSVLIVSQSSPEGRVHHNTNLSKRRAAAMRSYMVGHYPRLKNRLTIVPDGESWQQLRQYIVDDNTISEASKERILQIIDDDSVPIEEKKLRLAGDNHYRYLYAKYYPVIRNSQIEIVYQKPIPPIAMPKLAFPSCGIEQPAHIHKPFSVSYQYAKTRDTLVIAAKTNLLYDAITALNFELEIPIGNHFSVAVEDVFPWWEKDNKYCFQMWEMGVEGRYWFRKNAYYADKLRGHFLGAYGMSAKFDFQNDRKLCYQGEYWSAGLTYGYSLKLCKHLNMEFSLSVGWLSSAYRHYYPADDYDLLWRDKNNVGRIGYFGPTKLKVALVCPIRIPYNKRGGLR